jgi:hypothetical protein
MNTEILKKLADKPSSPGEFTIVIDGVDTTDELYLTFDGKKWIGLEDIPFFTKGHEDRIFYYDKKQE